MEKKYIVRLTEGERDTCREAVNKLVGTGQRVRRAQILLKADADGPGWTDERIAEAFSCRRQTVENVRRRFVEDGFEGALERKKREAPPRKLDGAAEAEVIALRLGPPPVGYANWSLRLLAGKVVELGIAETISHETVRQTLKKTASPGARCSIG